MNGLEELKRLAYENACCRCQYYENGKCQNKGECVWSSIEKELKAFEIIKRTALKLVSLEDDTTICKKGRYAFYDAELYGSKDLTKDEFDLLKEVMK